MAVQEKYPGGRISQASPKDSNLIQKGSSLGTEWQTPVISEPYRSRFSRCSGVADSADSAIGTSCSDIVEEFCSSSGSSSFQPIKRQVNIPTAHVMPSTLGTSPVKPASTPTGLLSSKPPVSGLSENVGWPRNGDLSTMNRSPGLPRDLMYLCGTPGENGIEQSWFPALGHEREEEMRKFDTPNMEPTLNQSVLMETLYSDPYYRFPLQNPTAETGKELYKVLPESKKTPGVGAGCEQNGTHAIAGELLQAASGFSKPLQSQGWLQAPDTWHSQEQSCELSTCRQQLESIRLQMEQMKELQRENTFLRAQFAQKTEVLSKEKMELEKKLSASEVDAQLIRESLRVALQKHSEEGKKQEERVKGRDKHINNLKKKCQKESEQNREKQQRIETLERYLADLPTREDHQKQSQKLRELELKNSDLQEQMTDLERKLGEARAGCSERESQLESLKQRERELLSAVHSLQDKQCSKKAGGGSLVQQVESPKVETESLQKECDCLRKIVDKQQKKIDQLCSQVKSLEAEVAQEEGAGQALKEEARRRENALEQLRLAVKELSGQNQDLIEKNLTLQEHLRQAQPASLPSADTAQLAQELHHELGSCLHDLQAVCSIVTQRAQGKDPNLSLLLGIHSVAHPSTEPDLQKPDVIIKKLEEVRQLHRDIEELRTTISDRYAQDMGDNCITQ
ncbi:centrosomal protein of 85 kDa isoform X3 [Dromiciops gliroides]|uniref:centrosomal protein of 85 kDa isoform X3 n=1 Tax=Dromiciops gliroides TaxID=33562 RepID=UPI001CC47199|nr:centrosomal protein of 85 kDa isoform X3 [Dromiciops gliroides]